MIGAFFAAIILALVWFGHPPVQAPGFGPSPVPAGAATPAPASTPAAAQRQALEFRMTDFEHGWIRYTDGMMATEDGGETWHAAVSDPAGEASPSAGALSGTDRKLAAVSFASKQYQVKQTQFATERIGWVLLADDAGLKAPVLVTADGGTTWHAGMTPEIKEAVLSEQKRQQQIGRETSFFASPEDARAALQSEAALMPDTAYPGDVVLVRHSKPGEVVWQDKTYKLQPFGSGYYAYLPVTKQVKSGKYPVGGQTLTVKDKAFETQYLNVSKQMEQMRQDTGRIEADQKKIDAARGKSQPEFLFTGAFIQPVQGILTTPFGYTRYINGKYDSSHMAIDLAAKEGTPIKATNDGVVALADSLYLTGNSIYIDHGMGLFSQYAHLQELRVKAGDRVKRGDIIGLVGTTGFSTGPHLHFTFWANNVAVNPNLFFDKTPFQWLVPPAR